MRAINVLLSILVSLLLGLLVFEGGLRLLGMGPPKVLNRPDPRIGWVKQPGLEVGRSTSEYRVRFEMNELGLRDDPMPSAAKPAGTFRVLALGDSFTLGFAVERDDLFVDLLESWWRAEGRQVDVVNAGTEGYSTDQEARWLMVHGEAFQPDLVLLFPYDNDYYWNGQSEYFGKPKPRFDAAGALEAEELADPAPKAMRDRFAVARLLGGILGAREDSSAHVFEPSGGKGPILKEHGVLLAKSPEFMADAVQRTKGALIALKRECEELGARLVVVPIPSHGSIDPDFAKSVFGPQVLGLSDELWAPDRPVDLMLGLCRDLGIEALDPRTSLRAASQTGEDLYYQKDWHFNPKGNRAFASFLHDELAARDVFPADHAAMAQVGMPEFPPAERGFPFWIKLYLILWVLLTTMYALTYRDEPLWQPPLRVAALLALVFAIFMGVKALVVALPPSVSRVVLLAFVVGILGFVAYKLGNRLATIGELVKAFVMRGHWYLMPVVVVLLTVGSLLVVAASSPLVAPFIYTLF